MADERRSAVGAAGDGPSGRSDAMSDAFHQLLAASPLPMWVYDLETLRFLEVNDAAVTHYGYRRADFLAMSITEIRPEEDLDRLHAAVAGHWEATQYSGAWRHRRSDGTILEVEVVSHRLEWEGRPAVLVVARDLTDTRRLEAELKHRTHYDAPTGLANATLFADKVAAALARPAPDGAALGVVLVGLCALDAVVSTAGDPAAHAMVSATGERLAACCEGRALPAHLGGGRFAVLVEAPEPEIMGLAGSVVAALSPPVAVTGWGELKCVPAVGIALAPASARDAADLIRDATSAMHHAAQRGGGHFVVFNAELRAAAVEAFETERALEAAIGLGELRLDYQPIVDLQSGETIGCESLVRWERPAVGLVGPDRFVPLAERSDLIVRLGAWVIEHALAEASTWPARVGARPRVSVNLSARQLGDSRLVARVAEACAAFGLPPSAVCAELTESAFVATDDYAAYRTLAGLRELGVEVAIDDFGTGYSSLAYVKHLPVDVVKIDRGFVAGLGTIAADTLLVDAVVRVAHGLDMRVVAEGVETEVQLDVLRGLGCDAAQGYLLAPPAPPERLGEMIDNARRVVAGARRDS